MSYAIKIVGIGKTGQEVINWLRKAQIQGAELIPAGTSKIGKKLKNAQLAFIICEDQGFPKPDFLPSETVAVAVICHQAPNPEKIEEIRKGYNTMLLLDEVCAGNTEIIGSFLKTLVEGISQPNLVGLDLSEVTQLLRTGEIAALGVGHSTIENIEEATKQALKFNKLTRKTWARVYAYFIGGADMSLEDLDKAGNVISKKLHTNSDIVWGAKVEQKMKGKVKVMVLLTGLE